MTAPFPKATIEGYPRVGAHRELKRALESYWSGKIDAETFESAAGESLDDEFTLARGNKDTAPLEMTKWFDTNYHYIVPEISDDQTFSARPQRVLKIVEEARAAGHTVRPVLVGPVTLLALSKQAEGATKQPLDRLDELVDSYLTVLEQLADANVEWLQLVEPALVADLAAADDATLAAALKSAYGRILSAEKRPQVYLTTPYGSLNAGLDVIAELKPEAVQVDLSVGTLALDNSYLERVAKLAEATHLSAGLVDGRNVWAANLRDLREKLETLGEGVSVTTSVSLQHVPHTVEAETSLPVDVATWFAFADEKIREVVALAAGPLDAPEAYAQADRAVRTRAESSRIHNQAVQERTAQLPEGQVQRQPEFAERNKAQEALGLPQLPTTTIGSFPQTSEIRAARAAHRKGELSDADYTEALRNEVKSVIELQERLGLDVLVHGEPERNDMVQYFAELLDGFVVTENGWVQSYGSRCTRPPIVVGDISRPKAMTTEWAKFAQSLSEKHVKGMLTGPVTILAWSFVRDDVHQSVSADQLGVALADEVRDLEEAGIDIIQIDEPALRELLPLREKDRKAYLDWAVRSFRVVSLQAKPETQIHTHLCYSEFGQIIDAVAGLDADVTSIEAARSRMELLEDIDEKFHSEIGPGIYDIHSPRIPSVAEMAELIRAALKNVPVERLWVNPDCGLKTRGYEETEASLRNLVLARDEVRSNL